MTLQMSWTTGGQGDEPLVLLHGIGSARDDFAAVRPELERSFAVLSPDLPGHGDSPPLPGPATVPALADVVEADLDRLGAGRVHLLGNSVGGRLALELAVRGRARSVVALSPSGLNWPAERLYQALVMAAGRLGTRSLSPVVGTAARFPLSRAIVLSGLRSMPWRASETEARAVHGGFGAAEGFWSMLWWAVVADLPSGLDRIDVPVLLAQGTADLIAGGQTPRYLFLVPGSSFTPLWGAGHAPQSDAPAAIVDLVRRAAAAAAARSRSGEGDPTDTGPLP